MFLPQLSLLVVTDIPSWVRLLRVRLLRVVIPFWLVMGWELCCWLLVVGACSLGWWPAARWVFWSAGKGVLWRGRRWLFFLSAGDMIAAVGNASGAVDDDELDDRVRAIVTRV